MPAKVARSIHRVAALLETVDLEFERVLSDRDSWASSTQAVATDTSLDTDNLKRVLDETLPPENRSETEDYSDLLRDLGEFGIRTVGQFRELARRRIKAALEVEKREFAERVGEKKPLGTTLARMRKGVFYTHVGLTRELLSQEFGERWNEYNRANTDRRRARRGKG